MFDRFNPFLEFIGIDLRKGRRNIRGRRWFLKDKKEFQRQLADDPDFKLEQDVPIFSDKYDAGGVMSGHYFHQDLLVAQRIYQNKPVKHVDVASRIDGFVAHVATFREIEVFDIRPAISKTPNIKFTAVDFSSDSLEWSEYADSLSCLHAIEHFGLGRYNDPIDAFGHVKGLNNLHKILKKGGTLYLSAPIGRQRVEFNCQRVFSVSYLLKLFGSRFSVTGFSYVDDAGDLHENVGIADEEQVKANFGCHFGCGIFELIKL